MSIKCVASAITKVNDVTSSSRLYCLDTVMLDIVVRVDALPTSGHDILATQRLLTTGGGYNAMSAAARHMMPVSYAGRLGTGPFSQTALSNFEKDGIDAPLEPHESLDLGFCIVMLEPSGERSFITSKGAEDTLRASDLAQLSPQEGDFVLLSGYNIMYPGFSEVVLDWIESLNDEVEVALDPSNRVYDIPSEYLQRALRRIDWLLCNEEEAGFLAEGGPLTRVNGVVVRHGETGCTIAYNQQEPVQVDGFVTDVVDTNGAGDVHNGVFLAELARGTDVIEAAERANAAAAMAISKLGPATGPTRDAVTKWMSR